MSEENEAKKKEVEWKPDPKITMDIKKGDEWKPAGSSSCSPESRKKISATLRLFFV